MMYQVKVVGRSTKGPVVEVHYTKSIEEVADLSYKIEKENKPFALTEIIIQER